MKELTDSQIKRQDFVDNMIFDLITSINPSRKSIEWDIEMISDIRDKIQCWFVQNCKLTDEQTFYPYIEM